MNTHHPRLRDLRRLRALGLSYAKCRKYADQAEWARLTVSFTRATLPAWSAQPQPATRSLSDALTVAFDSCVPGGALTAGHITKAALHPPCPSCGSQRYLWLDQLGRDATTCSACIDRALRPLPRTRDRGTTYGELTRSTTIPAWIRQVLHSRHG